MIINMKNRNLSISTLLFKLQSKKNRNSSQAKKLFKFLNNNDMNKNYTYIQTRTHTVYCTVYLLCVIQNSIAYEHYKQSAHITYSQKNK